VPGGSLELGGSKKKNVLGTGALRGANMTKPNGKKKKNHGDDQGKPLTLYDILQSGNEGGGGEKGGFCAASNKSGTYKKTDCTNDNRGK